MSVATPIVGVNAKVTFTPAGGSEVTLKNSKWTLKKDPNIAKTTNTTDGIVRAVGLQDAEGTVNGFLDSSQPIEADISEGTTGVLKLYRNATKFYSLTAIIGTLNISTGTDEPEQWDFNYMLQSGSVTEPV